jgi:hypothetical protein
MPPRQHQYAIIKAPGSILPRALPILRPALANKKALANASAFFNEIHPYGWVKYASRVKFACGK